MQSPIYAFPARKFQILPPGSANFSAIAWMYNKDYVAVGGQDGSLRVMLLNLEQEKASGSTLNPWLSCQLLEGHHTGVRLLCWNEVYQKLASSDEMGLIVVWMNHGSDESWFEEMVNNRQKSTVTSMKWSNDGLRIAIAYEDGQIIVGSVDGNRIWHKDLGAETVKIAWNPDDSLIVIAFVNGEVNAFDQYGNFVVKLNMLCVESSPNETTTSYGLNNRESRKDLIVSLEWYAPPQPCKIVNTQRGKHTKMDTSQDDYVAMKARIPENRPRLLIAYQNGNIQIMCNETSTKNISIVRLPSTVIISTQWSPEGDMFAVAGIQTNLPENERNVLHLISAFGMRLQGIRMPSGLFSGIAWESSGLRIGALIDTNIYLIVLKLPYKMAYGAQTLVFAYKSPLDPFQDVLVFYETKMEVKTTRSVQNLCCLKAYGDYCAVILRTNELRGADLGTPVDSQSTNVTPDYVAINGSMLLVATSDSFTVWHYTIPKTVGIVDGFRSTQHREQDQRIFYIDENQKALRDELQPSGGRTMDPITAVCAAPNFFIIARESGSLYRYTLPEVHLQCVYRTNLPSPTILEVNFSGSRLAYVTRLSTLRLFDITPNSAAIVQNFERKEDKDDTLAIMEKHRLVIVRGTESEEPVTMNGRICQFKDLVVRTVLIDDVLRDPDRVNKSHFIDIEIKILKQVKHFLESGNIHDAIGLVEKNSHPKLWSILATAALRRLDLKTAEHAFAKQRDYAGIMFIKQRLQSIQSEALRKAEVAMFLGELDRAEKIYFENDRRDLAIDMLKKQHDWTRIQQIIHDSSGSGDDILRQQAWKHVGDYYFERQKWLSASKHYEQSLDYVELAQCYLMMNDFAHLESLYRKLPDGHALLVELADIFLNYGLCEHAVDCYLRCDRIREAFEACIKLNKWDKATELSERYKLADVENLLANYAIQISGNRSKNLAVAQLYRKAAKYLQAAKIVFEMASQERTKQAAPIRLKKLYVMGALLVEDYHEQNRTKLAREKGEDVTSASIALEGILNEDRHLSTEDMRLVDRAWRGAEAYHFFMLAHKQLFQNQCVAAMRTSLASAEYDDILDPLEVYSLLALTSYAAGYYGLCSRAFMRLETISTVSAEEREIYAKLAMQIFLRNDPKDQTTDSIVCTNCGETIPSSAIVCPNPSCNNRLPICIASGRPLNAGNQFWLCSQCKHRANEQEIRLFKYCPLCHFEIAS